ncbi:retropepsin-like aspartic protease family protein [Rhodoferax ferrireducens]|uniref:retropepsin-like aspartic protease family protein n=1 Tax=Rhodoferax ferrireducens TaxID=192843 RepID=UPI001E4F4001|nr:TIGR02281 family clan AA aspartic protease [Rhodoferax ferrireducens]
MKTTALLLALLTLGPLAMAQTVALSGMLGGKALLIVDGSPPKTVAVGEAFRGVKIVSTQGDQAVMEIAGKRHTLRVGEAPASVGGSAGGEAGGTRVVLSAGSGGHFFTQGQINGRAVQLVVDTGATMVSLSVADAQRVGLNYKAGQAVQMSTANGVIPGWRLKLASVRIGDVVVYDVDAIVSSGAMPYVLLGNSFLARFQMTRTNEQMVLEKRY